MKNAERIIKTKSGIKWSFLDQVVSQGANIFFAVLLTRLLAPEMFGLIGMVLIFTGLLNVVQDFGISSALIYKKDITNQDLSTAFWAQVFIGIFLAVLFIGSRGYIAQFFNNPEIKPLIFFISFVFIIDSFGYVHLAFLKKKLLFKKIFLVQTTSVLLSGITALTMALNSFGVWSLVVKIIVMSLVQLIMLWIVVGWKPRFVFSKTLFKEQLHYGLPLVGNQITVYFMRNSDSILIGKFIGAEALGVYNRAYSLMLMPVMQIIGIVNKVMFPSFSLIQSNNKLFLENWLQLTRFTVFLVLPITSLIFLLAEPFVLLILGEQWAEIIPILKYLSFAAAVQPIGAIGFIFNAKGKTKELFKMNLVINSLLVAAIALSVPYGIQTVALSYSIASLLFIPLPVWFITSKIVGTQFTRILKEVRTVVLSNILIFLIMIYFDNIAGLSHLLKLFSTPLIYLGAYIGLLHILHEKTFNELLQFFRK